MPKLLAREPKPFFPYAPVPLFSPSYAEYINHSERIRPLPGISDFVVERMPNCMLAIHDNLPGAREQFIQQAHAAIEEYTEGFGGIRRARRTVTQGEHPEIALTDLLFLQAALHHVDVESVPNNLKRVINRSARKMGRTALTITYDDIINPQFNPSTDRRTFYPINSLLGQQEWQFAQTHTEVEANLSIINHAIYTATMLLNERGQDGINQAAQILRGVGFADLTTLHQRLAKTNLEKMPLDARTPVDVLVYNMHQVGQIMYSPSFLGFRANFPSVDSRFNGASGAQSTGIPLMELLLAGDVLTPERYVYIRQQVRPYASKEEQQMLSEAWRLASRRPALTLDAVFTRLGRPEELKLLIQGASFLLHRFRGEHTIGIRQQDAALLTGQAPATGNPNRNTKQFLMAQDEDYTALGATGARPARTIPTRRLH